MNLGKALTLLSICIVIAGCATSELQPKTLDELITSYGGKTVAPENRFMYRALQFSPPTELGEFTKLMKTSFKVVCTSATPGASTHVKWSEMTCFGSDGIPIFQAVSFSPTNPFRHNVQLIAFYKGSEAIHNHRKFEENVEYEAMKKARMVSDAEWEERDRYSSREAWMSRELRNFKR